MEIDSAKVAGPIVAMLATAAAQYFAATAPAIKQADLDRDGNWSCRSQLLEVRAERDQWIARYLGEPVEP